MENDNSAFNLKPYFSESLHHYVKDAKDAIIAHNFLQQFVEARRQPALSTSPSCSYSKTPPLELSQDQTQAVTEAGQRCKLDPGSKAPGFKL